MMSVVIFLEFVVLTAGVVMAAYYAPIESSAGIGQKIIYVHLPAACACFAATALMFVASVWYLFRPGRRFDRFAHCCAMPAWVFCTITVATGCLWFRHVSGVWWQWDARVTTFLILWCILTTYEVLRVGVPMGRLQGRLAAAFGVMAFLDLLLVVVSLYWWRAVDVKILGVKQIAMHSAMLQTLVVMLAATLGAMMLLIYLRHAVMISDYRLARLTHRLTQERRETRGTDQPNRLEVRR
jgi:heme exporter protein C